MPQQTEHEFEYPEVDGVEYFRADDGRMVAILVRSDFDSYEAFHPHLETEEEQKHLEEAYDVDVEQERKTKAHITEYEFPLQLVILTRPEGSSVNPHYHEADEHPESPTRYQIMFCQRGALDVGVYTKEGDHLGTPRLESGDLIVLAEGHSFDFAEDDTKVFEFKQGPFPGSDEADKVDLEID